MNESLIRIGEAPAIEIVLRELCDLTNMGFAAVARVTDQQWIACQVLDRIDFGLEAGGELKIKTTICDEIRQSGEPVYIDSVTNSPAWKLHPTPILYGFQSYVSVPLFRQDGSFFGTLCAVDPYARTIDTPEMHMAIDALAVRVIACLE